MREIVELVLQGGLPAALTIAVIFLWREVRRLTDIIVKWKTAVEANADIALGMAIQKEVAKTDRAVITPLDEL